MKKHTFYFCLFTFVFCLLLQPSLSQIPEGFNYQAIARDVVTGNPITDPINIMIAILSEDDPENVIWEELHSGVDPDDHGLFSVVIGQGICQTDPVFFDDIDWTVTPKYIRTKIFYGGEWKSMGSAQIWSVPYAIQSQSSEQWKNSGANIYRSSGNVGINTSTPAAALDVNGEGIFRASIAPAWVEMNAYSSGARFSGIDFHGDDYYTDFSLRILRNNTGQDAYSRIWHRGLGQLQILTNEAAPIDLLTAGSHRLRVAPDGKIGIGTTSPAYLLDVYGEITARATNSFRLRQSTYSTILRNDNSAFYMLLTNSGDPDGTWNTLRPFSISMGSGNVGIGNGALYVQHGGNVGVGTTTPGSKMVIQPSTSWSDEVPLFEVKNKYGISVLSVFNYGVRILVDNTDSKAIKGGFAIGGYDYTKAGSTYEFMRVTPDSIRFNINNSPTKAVKGGFAIGGYGGSKNINQDFMYITPTGSPEGEYNTFIGHLAGNSNVQGDYNTFIGINTGKANINGDANTFMGLDAGTANTYGNSNVGIGTMALNGNTLGGYNTALGYLAGSGNTIGDGNIFLGQYAGSSESGSNKLYIGIYNTIYGDLITNKVVINGKNNPNNRTFFVNGTAGGSSGWYNDSDERLKRDITEIPDALNRLLCLRGVNFYWKDPEDGMESMQMGFIGQEAVEVIPEVVSVNNDHYSMQYAPITALLVEAVKEQNDIIRNQQAQIDRLEKLVEELMEK